MLGCFTRIVFVFQKLLISILLRSDRKMQDYFSVNCKLFLLIGHLCARTAVTCTKGDIYHCKTVLFQNVWLMYFSVNTSERVCVCEPDAWKACCVVNSTSLKHWAAGEQLVCDSFYWNYLFLITMESKFKQFPKSSA